MQHLIIRLTKDLIQKAWNMTFMYGCRIASKTQRKLLVALNSVIELNTNRVDKISPVEMNLVNILVMVNIRPCPRHIKKIR